MHDGPICCNRHSLWVGALSSSFRRNGRFISTGENDRASSLAHIYLGVKYIKWRAHTHQACDSYRRGVPFRCAPASGSWAFVFSVYVQAHAILCDFAILFWQLFCFFPPPRTIASLLTALLDDARHRGLSGYLFGENETTRSPAECAGLRKPRAPPRSFLYLTWCGKLSCVSHWCVYSRFFCGFPVSGGGLRHDADGHVARPVQRLVQPRWGRRTPASWFRAVQPIPVASTPSADGQRSSSHDHRHSWTPQDVIGSYTSVILSRSSVGRSVGIAVPVGRPQPAPPPAITMFQVRIMKSQCTNNCFD